MDLGGVQSADFTPYLHHTFRIYPEAGEPIDAELIEISDYPLRYAKDPEGRRPFSLLFRVAPDIYLPQKNYPLEHEIMGRFELFLVPIGPDKEGMCLESIFN